MKHLAILAILMLAIVACKEDKKQGQTQQQPTRPQLEKPAFDADSAYYFVKKQVDFGPRVPGTTEHKKTSEWLVNKLGSFTDTAFIQKGMATMYNDNEIPVYNIIGAINPEIKERVLLAAHWDSRHIADKDFDKSKYNEAILGANDGASGVGVLLEMARQLQKENSQLGIDFIFFDAEDLGAPSDYTGDKEDTWCLGSQYWAANPHIEDYKAKYGILLDMVGASDAVFKFELYGYQKAAPLYNKTWNIAHQLGYTDKFLKAGGGAITDDHFYVMEGRGFPMIDIIDYEPNREGGFGHYHHTHQDNMDVISKSTLKVVGETVLGVLKY